MSVGSFWSRLLRSKKNNTNKKYLRVGTSSKDEQGQQDESKLLESVTEEEDGDTSEPEEKEGSAENEVYRKEESLGEDVKQDDQLAKANDGLLEEKFRAEPNDFTLKRNLGEGTFGLVKLVEHKGTGELLAMKILSKAKLIQLKQVEHTLNERKILSQVSHPFIVRLKFHFHDCMNLYLVMEFVNGGEMFFHLQRLKKFSEPLSRFYAAQIVHAIEYLHNADIIFRDLKPENILIDSEGYLKITDFGFAKKVKSRTWTLCGTPEYLAPEIILNKGYGAAVDWWAVGVLIFEMAAGRSPFYVKEPIKIYEKIVAVNLTYPPHFKSDLLDLLQSFFQTDLTRRIGNLRGRAGDIRGHAWFSSTNWLSIFHRKETPPWKPDVRNIRDSHNFPAFESELAKEKWNLALLEENEHLFDEF